MGNTKYISNQILNHGPGSKILKLINLIGMVSLLKKNNYDIIYDDETLDNEVWSSLIDSDVLVISKSAYSYSAGVLCDGLVIYPEEGMFHPKLKDWKSINEL